MFLDVVGSCSAHLASTMLTDRRNVVKTIRIEDQVASRRTLEVRSSNLEARTVIPEIIKTEGVYGVRVQRYGTPDP
eukprot:524777-Pyramimonas_sp.AAC.1